VGQRYLSVALSLHESCSKFESFRRGFDSDDPRSKILPKRLWQIGAHLNVTLYLAWLVILCGPDSSDTVHDPPSDAAFRRILEE
jgi:hypothetical protein